MEGDLPDDGKHSPLTIASENYLRNTREMLAVVVYTRNPSTQEEETGDQAIQGYIVRPVSINKKINKQNLQKVCI